MWCNVLRKRKRRAFAALLALQLFMVKNSLTIQGERHILFFKSEVAAKLRRSRFTGKKARADRTAEQAGVSACSKKGALIKSERIKPFA
jgi:hypothetical protein